MESELITEDERNLLIKYRQQIVDLETELPKLCFEDKSLVRWIRARNNNLKDAETMIRNHAAWRKETEIDKIVSYKLPPEWDEYFTWRLYGFDSYNNPVFTAQVKTWDIEAVVKAGLKEEFIRFIMAHCERTARICQNKSEGKEYIPQIVGIYEMKGLALRQFNSPTALSTILSVIKQFEANFPETVRRLYLLNAPWIFQIVWNLLRPILSEKSSSKIIFLGSRKDEWRAEISKQVPLDQFPKSMGGDGSDESIVS